MAYVYKVTEEDGTERTITFAKASWAVTQVIWQQMAENNVPAAMEAAFTNLCNEGDRKYLHENGAVVWQLASSGSILDKITGGVTVDFIQPSKETK
jgi:hypothetical protein